MDVAPWLATNPSADESQFTWLHPVGRRGLFTGVATGVAKIPGSSYLTKGPELHQLPSPACHEPGMASMISWPDAGSALGMQAQIECPVPYTRTK